MPQRLKWLPILIALVCAAALALLLFTGVQQAARLQSASSALQLAAGLTTQPQLMHSELTLVQRGLETQTYVGDSLKTLSASRAASNQAFAQLATTMQAAELSSRADAAGSLTRAQQLWAPLDAGLLSLANSRSADLYADSAASSALTAAGARLKRKTDEVLATQAKSTAALTSELVGLAALLREAVVLDGRSLRALLLGGSGLASLLLATMLYFSWRAAQSASAASSAQRQIANIMSTVREGLFLIGRDGRIGGAHSDSLRVLLRVPAPAGENFEDLLRPLVDEKTLQATGRYLGLLWKDKVNEELIESVNPLNQIELSFHKPQGPAEVRYLSFSFRRVRGLGAGAGADFVFGVVTDVTERVLLQRELEHLKSDTDSQSALLMQLLQVEPLQLSAFLGSVDAGLRRSNALLRAPGRQAQELRDKVQGVFREMHALKGEAAALGLGSFVRRTHEIEDQLSELRSRPELAGNDFVPLVVKLDELMSHAQSLSGIQERVGSMRPVANAAAASPPARHADSAASAAPAGAAPPATPPGSELDALLRRLATEVGTACGREIRLLTEGLELVPERYAQRVREICVQMLRNAIVHGIEPREQRAAEGKPPTGTVRVRFNADKPEHYSLLVEDDGKGLEPDQIRSQALERGLVDADQAAALDRSGVFRLLFQPGFSTTHQVTEHAGRGVGLDLVNAAVREFGGRIGISTTAGKFTRFKLLLPRTSAEPASHSSAA